MYNKNQFKKINDKKILHKIGKHWVTISVALLSMLTGGAIATHTSVSANTINNTNHSTINSRLHNTIKNATQNSEAYQHSNSASSDNLASKENYSNASNKFNKLSSNNLSSSTSAVNFTNIHTNDTTKSNHKNLKNFIPKHSATLRTNNAEIRQSKKLMTQDSVNTSTEYYKAKNKLNQILTNLEKNISSNDSYSNVNAAIYSARQANINLATSLKKSYIKSLPKGKSRKIKQSIKALFTDNIADINNANQVQNMINVLKQDQKNQNIAQLDMDLDNIRNEIRKSSINVADFRNLKSQRKEASNLVRAYKEKDALNHDMVTKNYPQLRNELKKIRHNTSLRANQNLNAEIRKANQFLRKAKQDPASISKQVKNDKIQYIIDNLHRDALTKNYRDLHNDLRTARIARRNNSDGKLNNIINIATNILRQRQAVKRNNNIISNLRNDELSHNYRNLRTVLNNSKGNTNPDVKNARNYAHGVLVDHRNKNIAKRKSHIDNINHGIIKALNNDESNKEYKKLRLDLRNALSHNSSALTDAINKAKSIMRQHHNQIVNNRNKHAKDAALRYDEKTRNYARLRQDVKNARGKAKKLANQFLRDMHQTPADLAHQAHNNAKNQEAKDEKNRANAKQKSSIKHANDILRHDILIKNYAQLRQDLSNLRSTNKISKMRKLANQFLSRAKQSPADVVHQQVNNARTKRSQDNARRAKINAIHNAHQEARRNAYAKSGADKADKSIANSYSNSVSASVSTLNSSIASSAAKSTDDSIDNSIANSAAKSADNSIAQSDAKSADQSLENSIALSYARSADASIADKNIASSESTSVSNSVSAKNKSIANSYAQSANNSIAASYQSSISNSVSSMNSSIASSYSNSVSASVSTLNSSIASSAAKSADNSIANSYINKYRPSGSSSSNNPAPAPNKPSNLIGNGIHFKTPIIPINIDNNYGQPTNNSKQNINTQNKPVNFITPTPHNHKRNHITYNNIPNAVAPNAENGNRGSIAHRMKKQIKHNKHTYSIKTLPVNRTMTFNDSSVKRIQVVNHNVHLHTKALIDAHTSPVFTRRNHTKNIKAGKNVRINKLFKVNNNGSKYECALVSYHGHYYYAHFSSQNAINNYYYSTHHHSHYIKVLRGLHTYRSKNFNSSRGIGYIRKGNKLRISKIVKLGHYGITRIKLVNGSYITGLRNYVKLI